MWAMTDFPEEHSVKTNERDDPDCRDQDQGTHQIVVVPLHDGSFHVPSSPATCVHVAGVFASMTSHPAQHLGQGRGCDHNIVGNVRPVTLVAEQLRPNGNVRPMLNPAIALLAKPEYVPGHEEWTAYRRQHADDEVRFTRLVLGNDADRHHALPFSLSTSRTPHGA